MLMSSNDKIKCLYNWCTNQTKGYRNVEIKNFTSSWRNGLGFCAILHQYGPEFIDFDSLKPDNIFDNCQIAFEVGEKHFGIPALLDAKDMEIMKCPDRLSVITYLLQYYATLAPKRPKVANGGPLRTIETNVANKRLSDDQVIEQTSTDEDQAHRDQLTCEMCSQVIYFLEKLSVNDKYYHRACYRQTQLTNLKMRNLTLERPKAAESTTNEVVSTDRKSRLRSPTVSSKAAFWTDNDSKKANIENDNSNVFSSDGNIQSEKVEINSKIEEKKYEKKVEDPVAKSDIHSVKIIKEEPSNSASSKGTEVVKGDQPRSSDKEMSSPNGTNEKEVPLSPRNDIDVKKELQDVLIGDTEVHEYKEKVPEKSHISTNNNKEGANIELANTCEMNGSGSIHLLPAEELPSLNIKSEDETLQGVVISSENDRKRVSIDDKPDDNKANNSNIEMVNYPRKLSLRSLSPELKPNRPPSLDSLLEKISLRNSTSKPFNQILTDRSSPSGSSVNYISINASSTDSLSNSHLVVGDIVKDNLIKSPKSLHPDSLNFSTSSLNSSFNKKRHAPPPPPPPPPSSQPESGLTTKSSNVSMKPLTVRKVFLKTDPVYPEDRNPFAIAEDAETNKMDTNPFAEFMTDPSNDDAFSKPTTPSIKPRKRVAPKIPPKPSVCKETNTANVSKPLIRNFPPSLNLNGNHNVVYPTQIPNSVNTSSKDSNVTTDFIPPSNTTTPIVPPKLPTKEIENEPQQASESIRKPEPLKRSKRVMEKSKSNDALNMLDSSLNNKLKPPAPPRPPPKKREVRADTSHEFIPYDSLYSELEEVNIKQSEMEIKGRAIQDALKEVNDKDEGYEALLQDWLDIVEKKNAMYSREHHLHEILRRQELEDRHSDLEFELRILMGKQESLKSATEKAREEELLNQILDTVNARAKMVDDDEEQTCKSGTNEAPKRKTALRKFFSSKHRSNSLGKSLFNIKINKKPEKTKTFRSVFYEDKK